MFDYIKGKLITKQFATANGAYFVVENNNIGYLINTTNRNISHAGEDNSDIKLFTALIHREDTMLLCGFLNKEDRDIFNILLTVSGVGMKVALVLLDEFSGCDLISVVISGDYKALSKAKGVGPKLAQKIILELKDKLVNWQKKSPIFLENTIDLKENNQITTDVLSEVQAVLLSLGYSNDEIKLALKYACQHAEKTDSAEIIIKEALSYLSQE